MATDWFFARMFHRRLALLSGAAGVVSLVLAGQLVRLTAVQGTENRALADSRLKRRSYLATQRGRILDRKGRVLAKDAPATQIAVDYSVITGSWARDAAVREVRRTHRDTWDEMSIEQQSDAFQAVLPRYKTKVQQLWREIREQGHLSTAECDDILENIKREVRLMAEHTWKNQRAVFYQRYGTPESDENDPFKQRPILEQTLPHVILRDVSEEIAFHFRRLENDLPGLHVLESTTRAYPELEAIVELDRASLPEPLQNESTSGIEVRGVADHLLGGMRDNVWAEDVHRIPFTQNIDGESFFDLQGYRPGDHVGIAGLERVHERWLRGHRGIIDTQLNTGEVHRIEPEPGHDLQLTIDIALQSRIQAIMTPQYGLMQAQQYQAGWMYGEPRPMQFPAGTPLYGAAVVLDIDSSEILALVTTPTLADAQEWDEEDRKLFKPRYNRAVETPYPPGSIIKPLVLVAAVTEGVHRLSDLIECTGHYFPNWKDKARCWIYRPEFGYTTHSVREGPLTAPRAIAVSCNIYFYTLAERLGAAKLVEWYQRFGIGRYLRPGLSYERPDSTDPGKTIIVGEYPGEHPSDDEIAAGMPIFEQVILGIGQGKLAWTPLHAANAYATLARYGVVRDATLIRSGPDVARWKDDLKLDPEAVDAALEGLRLSVTADDGSGRKIRYADRHEEPIINAEGVIVWGKTGTAQAPAIVIDRDDDGKAEKVLRFDHAWWVGLVGSEADGRPRYAVSVLVEYGGSGGRTAGPVANQIIRALQTEGYLE